MTSRLAFQELIILGLAAATTLLALQLPAPLGYYAALSVMLIAPGRGFVALLFAPGYLSFAEWALLTILASTASIVAVDALLLAAGAKLDRGLVVTVAVALACLGSGMRIGAARRFGAQPVQINPNAVAFAIGLGATLIPGLVIYAILR